MTLGLIDFDVLMLEKRNAKLKVWSCLGDSPMRKKYVRYAFYEDFVTGPVKTSDHITLVINQLSRILVPIPALRMSQSLEKSFFRRNMYDRVHSYFLSISFRYPAVCLLLLSLINQCTGVECCISKWLSKLRESVVCMICLYVLYMHCILASGEALKTWSLWNPCTWPFLLQFHGFEFCYFFSNVL